MTIALEQSILATVTTGSITLASWTPSTDELLLLEVGQKSTGITPSISGNGMTWDEIATVTDAQSTTKTTLYRCMGSPSSGAITVTLTGNTAAAAARAFRISGTATGANGANAVEASVTAQVGSSDNNDLLVSVTTLTADAWAAAFSTHRYRTSLITLTLVDESSLGGINNNTGTGNNDIAISAFYQAVASPGATQLGGSNDLSGNTEWSVIAISIKPSAGGGTNYNQSLSGTVTSSGNAVKTTIKLFTGVVTSLGTLGKTTTKIIAGAIASSGIVQKSIFHLLTGIVTSAGSAGKVLSSTLAGVVDLAGTLVTTTSHHYTQVLSGSITPTGSLQKSIQKLLTGTLTPVGTLIKSVFKTLTGTVSSSGALTQQFPAPRLRQKPPSTIYRQDNLSFLITAPAWGGSSYSNDVSPFVQSYEHSSAAVGGFYSATLSLKLPLTELEDWLENSVGRQIQVKGRANTIAWEGIINRVSINVGGYNMTVGPYTDICNRVKITYSIFLQLGDGNATGIRVVTDYLNDTKSQLRYGILEKNFSTGGIESTSVDELQAMLLSRYAYPSRSEDLNLPGEAIRPHFDIKIECIGYGSLFEKYTYNSDTIGTQNLSAKLAAIIAAEPNGLFSGNLTVNTLQVPAYENDDSEAWGLIKELILQGDVSVNRYSFGVYENRRVIYKPVSNQIVYIRPFREGISVIQDSSGGLLQPWQIRPGNYIWVSDLITGKPISSNLNDDRRIIYADTVQYRMPDGLVINGAHHFKVEQRLAQLGISGLG